MALVTIGAVDGRSISIQNGSPILIVKVLESTPMIRDYQGPSPFNHINNEEDEQETKIIRIQSMNPDDDDLSWRLKMEQLRLRELASRFEEPLEKPQEEDVYSSRILRPLPFPPSPFLELPAFPPKRLDLRGYFLHKKFAALRKFMKTVLENIQGKRNVSL